jgi:hypothetical protein
LSKSDLGDISTGWFRGKTIFEVLIFARLFLESRVCVASRPNPMFEIKFSEGITAS